MTFAWKWLLFAHESERALQVLAINIFQGFYIENQNGRMKRIVAVLAE